MISLVEDNKEFGYKIYRSDTIVNHSQEMIERLHQSHEILMKNYSYHQKSSTWLYRTYNIFSLVGPSYNFYNLFYELNQVIKENYSQHKCLWFQSWLNFHNFNEVLDWHNHASYAHGYISIDPKNTKTVFKNYTILNELGNIYIGPGSREHKVEVLEPFEGKRITLGFDITNVEQTKSTDLISMIPVL